MKVSVEWLKSITDISAGEDLLAEGIPANGLEIETIKKTGIGKQDIVSCEIIEKVSHPESDKLFVTKVNAGGYGVKQIVTNLKSVKAGDKLFAALEDVKITEDFIIKKSKLRNVESEGMFIGWEELGFNYSSEDPIFLDSDTENGILYYELLPFNDSIIDIELTANRGDCLGMKGIASDIKARFNASLKEFSYQYAVSQKDVSDDISVEVKSENCFRYTGAVIKNVEIKPSPLWMQLRLIKAGIRPINNIVDITNYVLYEMNQPLHAFDLDKIGSRKIVVRDAYAGENITTLDGVERKLEVNDILISDPETGHCLGGIMGGQISEVSDSTKNVFLEAAFFNPVNIRKTSRRLGLRSESSYRFEREIDRANVDNALKRALYYFDLLKVGEISKGVIDVYPVKYQDKVIKTTADWINVKLGTALKADEIAGILAKLDFKTLVSGDDIEVTVPSWRNDVSIREDIAEETARIYGYNNIKPTLYPSTAAGVRTVLQKNRIKLHNIMTQSGCYEAFNFSFVGKSLFDKMKLSEDHPFRNVVTLEVPLTEDWSSMRSSLIPGLIRTASFNCSRQNKSFALYEMGNISIPANELLPVEKMKLGFILAGNKVEKNHCDSPAVYDFFDAKGIADFIFESFGTDVKYVSSNESYLQPYQQAEILINGKKAGVIGKIHPMLLDEFNIENNAFICEIDTDMIFDNCRTSIAMAEVPKFPSSERDLALLLNENVKAEDIISVIKSCDVDILKDVNIFDIYRGDKLEKGHYSLAVKLTFNKLTSTLTDSEIESAVKIILGNLESKLNAKLR